ncbi:major tail protein [Enterococcus phage vB_Efs4_KEN02]
MAKVFNVYKKTGKKVVTEQPSPVTITGLKAETEYAKGEYQVTAIEDGKPESSKVDVPAFTTTATAG